MRMRLCKKFIFWGFLSGLIFVMGCVSVYNPATEKKEIYFIDDRTEIGMGRNIAADLAVSNKMVQDEVMNRRVKNIGERIAAVSDRNSLTYNFAVIDSGEINAFAAPGGYIFVNRGLVEAVNDDELAFVLAHEIGHVCARHSVKRLQAALGFNLISSIALRNPEYRNIREGVNVIYNIISLGYSRQDELQADSLGIKYLVLAGYDSKGAVTMMEKLKEKSDRGYTFPFLRSHPPADERIQNIKAVIENTEAR